MALKFYMTPGSCSTGIHILLEALEVPFEAWIVNIPARAARCAPDAGGGRVPNLTTRSGEPCFAIARTESRQRGKDRLHHN
jgi:glutathione S-transferase